MKKNAAGNGGVIRDALSKTRPKKFAGIGSIV
jgi:hypothetical protein